MKDIVLIGSGGLAREVRWLMEECNKAEKRWNILGWIDKTKSGTMIAGLPVLGDDEWLINYEKPIEAVLSIGSGKFRKRLAEEYRKNLNISFPNIIAPDVCISDSVSMGCGCIITTRNVLTVDIAMGDFFVSNYASTIGHDCQIRDYVTLFPGVHVSGNVKLGECCSIGVGANIIQKISVGENSFVGAGAVVVRDIPSNCTAVGCPAKPLKGNDVRAGTLIHED